MARFGWCGTACDRSFPRGGPLSRTRIFSRTWKKLAAAGKLAGKTRAGILGGDAANDGTSETRNEGHLGFAKQESIQGASAARRSAPHADRLIGVRVRISRGDFRSCDIHTVAPRGLGRVEGRVDLQKKFFHRQAAPL